MSDELNIDEIRELAEAVAGDVETESATNLESILEQEGITISYNDYGPSFDGMLEYADGHFHIYCNLHYSNRKTSGRARFTVGHELGHYFIDTHRNGLISGRLPKHKSVSDYNIRNEIERQADTFASALLLPSERLDKIRNKSRFGIEAIKRIAEEFRTSISSTAIRYAQTASEPVAVIRWGRGGITWMEVSPSMRAGGGQWANVSAERLPFDSSTSRALNSAAGFFASCGTVATAWFTRRGPLIWTDAILVEEALSLGEYGALTVLYLDKRM